MQIKSLILVLCLLGCSLPNGFANQQVSQKPPEKKSLLQRIESSKWLSHGAKWMLREYAKDLLTEEEIVALSSLDKSTIVNSGEIGTTAVLLYEFATGIGPATRHFNQNDSFTQSVLRSPGMQWLLTNYRNQYEVDSLIQFEADKDQSNVRYQFSPLLFNADQNNWDFSFQQHLMSFDQQNLSQFMLGSFNADIRYVDEQTIQIHLWNQTSKKSLFGGLGNRIQRPLPLGTTRQHITCNINLETINNLLLYPIKQ